MQKQQHPSIVVFSRVGDGMVFIDANWSPAGVFHIFGGDVDQRHVTLPTPHAAAVVKQIHARFSERRLEPCGCWFALEFQVAQAALNEYDLVTGRRVGSAGIKLHDLAYVEGMGSGRVIGFPAGRVEVDLSPSKFADLIVQAPRSQVQVIA